MVNHSCPSCHSVYKCPLCGRIVVKKGFDKSRKVWLQIYYCQTCKKAFAHPRCSCPPHHPKSVAIVRKLGPSGRLCLVCKAPLNYCPNCGKPSLRSCGHDRRYDKDGKEISSRQIYQCTLCGRRTVNPSCNCILPHLSPKAVREARVRARTGHG